MIDESVLQAALVSSISDFEDAVQHAAAHAANLEAIVTRNTTDFKHATLAVYAPPDLIKLLTSP